MKHSNQFFKACTEKKGNYFQLSKDKLETFDQEVVTVTYKSETLQMRCYLDPAHMNYILPIKTLDNEKILCSIFASKNSIEGYLRSLIAQKIREVQRLRNYVKNHNIPLNYAYPLAKSKGQILYESMQNLFI